MATLIITATIAVVLVIVVLIQLIQKWRNQASKIPGLQPASKEDGNFGDMAKAGSFHQFLVGLHKRFGPVASFWHGSTQVISVGDPNLFKYHSHWNNRPYVLYKLFEPIFGVKSVAFDNGPDFLPTKSAYDKCLSHMALQKYYQPFQKNANDIVVNWENRPVGEHIPLGKYMSAYSLKSLLNALYGETLPESEIFQFKEVYDKVWGEMELRLSSPPTPAREKSFEKGRQHLRDITQRMVEARRKLPSEHADEYLIDVILDLNDTEQQFDDSITFVIAGFHTAANLLTWAFYFLAKHPDAQERVFNEIREVIGEEDVDHTNISQLQYLRQVLDETLRCSVLAPWSARFVEHDTELCGYTIPANTPVVQALGVGFEDENIWPSPHEFDPDRFSPENAKTRSKYIFSPFGFSGKHICPGKRFSYSEATVAMVTLLRKFEVTLVDGQVIGRVYGFVTHPSQEIWIRIKAR